MFSLIGKVQEHSLDLYRRAHLEEVLQYLGPRRGKALNKLQRLFE